MRNRLLITGITAFCFLVPAMMPHMAMAQLQGTDTTSGTACSVEDSVQMTANPSGTGGYILTCEGGVWVATLNAALPTANEQVATKEYVDSAVAAGGIGACVDDDTTLCALETNRSSDDPDFTAANIANGVNILGVTGTYTGGGGGGCTAPASCTSIGDVCSDGSIFAGFMVYNGSCEPLYVTDNNQSTSSQWKTVTGTNDITDPADKNDAVDGQYNRDNRGGGTFPAFELCENNTYHGKSDWYLPARAELNLLWLNQAAIDANAAGNFTTSLYWSSTEDDTNNAWAQHFGNGYQYNLDETTHYDVRCVRRD